MMVPGPQASPPARETNHGLCWTGAGEDACGPSKRRLSETMMVAGRQASPPRRETDHGLCWTGAGEDACGPSKRRLSETMMVAGRLRSQRQRAIFSCLGSSNRKIGFDSFAHLNKLGTSA